MMLLLSLTLAASAPTAMTVSVERLDVVAHRPSATLRVEPFNKRIVLDGLTIKAKAARLCPKISKRGDRVMMQCSTRRLWASLERDARGTYVDLRLLAGASWLDPMESVPMRAWAPREMGIPDSCPGTTPAVVAECALERGELARAEEAWTAALSGPDAAVAHVRLGDLLLAKGEVEAALQHYRSVGYVGPVGRLAEARACELLGTCFDEKSSARVGDTDGMPGRMAAELDGYTVRRELLAGRDAAAMERLNLALERHRAICEGQVAFCQKLVAAGLASDDQEARIGALSVFLTDSLRRGPLEKELTFDAATAAREVGAPGFAAAILASNTPRVARGELGPHLLQIVELYVAANDRVRARTVLDYADSRLGSATKQSAWARVRRAVEGVGVGAPQHVAPVVVDDAAMAALRSDVSLSTELARAASARSRAIETPKENTP